MHLSTPFAIYLLCWLCFSVWALLRTSILWLETGRRWSYLAYLCQPWKLGTFPPAALFVTFAGRYAWDDTWDEVTGTGMSALTYFTGPWAVGVAWLALSGRRPRWHFVLAVAACLVSASWFYDGWLLYRDGRYPDMWLANLLLSPFLYLAGGFLWNLEIGEANRVTFGFLRSNWPAPPSNKQIRPQLILAAMPPIVLAASILLFSVHWNLG